MKRLRAWMMRLGGLFGGVRRERELAELDSHLQMHVDDNLSAGMTTEQARREAVLQLGGIEATKQAYRERGTLPVIENVLQDLRFAIRQLKKNPGFTVCSGSEGSFGEPGGCAAGGVERWELTQRSTGTKADALLCRFLLLIFIDGQYLKR
jgi:hypothetical protein